MPNFAYSWPWSGTTGVGVTGVDASTERIEQHLAQLKPIFARNVDVIALFWGGFIGPWGEWHSSSSGHFSGPEDDINASSRRVFAAMLDAFPRERMFGLRFLEHRRALVGIGPLDRSQAFNGSPAARVGLRDDCYMADYHPEVRRRRLAAQPELDRFGRYVPQVETMDQDCFDFPDAVWKFVPCDQLLSHMAITHPDLINPLPTSRVAPECAQEAERRVGYRYRLIQVRSDRMLKLGDTLRLDLQLANDGFGALYNRRPLDIILKPTKGSRFYRLRASEDVRLILPEPGEEKEVSLSIPVPDNLQPGDYELLLHLPDQSANLGDRPNYSIRLANQGVWQSQTGLNSLKVRVHIHS